SVTDSKVWQVSKNLSTTLKYTLVTRAGQRREQLLRLIVTAERRVLGEQLFQAVTRGLRCAGPSQGNSIMILNVWVSPCRLCGAFEMLECFFYLTALDENPSQRVADGGHVRCRRVGASSNIQGPSVSPLLIQPGKVVERRSMRRRTCNDEFVLRG